MYLYLDKIHIDFKSRVYYITTVGHRTHENVYTHVLQRRPKLGRKTSAREKPEYSTLQCKTRTISEQGSGHVGIRTK